MATSSLALVLLLVWTIIHGANYFLRPAKTQQSLLPTSRGAAFLGRRRNYFWNSRTTQVVLNKLHLRVQISVWNGHHDTLSKAVSARSGAGGLRAALIAFYNAGCAMGVVGTVLALGLLLWTCANALVPLLISVPPSAQPTLLAKRALELELGGETAAQRTLIQPLVCLLKQTICVALMNNMRLDTRRNRPARPPAAHLARGFPVPDHPRARACSLRCAVSPRQSFNNISIDP